MMYKTPYRDLLPPLSTEELAALRADVKASNGVRDSACVDEEGNVLDGHHRLEIDPNCPVRVIEGLSPAEKEAFVFRANFVRRNLSPSQKNEARRKMKATAKRLREENPKKWTQKRVAEVLGVARNTVSTWFPEKPSTTNVSADNVSKPTVPSPPKPDARVKINPAAKPAIAAEVKAGKSQAQVAADLGVSQQAVSRIVAEETKKAAVKQQQQDAVRRLAGNIVGIHHGDFRKLASVVPDISVDMIFTDPPYDEESISLYGDLAQFATRVLKPGGWCLAYSGQRFLHDVMNSMEPPLTFGWTFGITHNGGDLRFRKYKLYNGWKPILGFYKPPLVVWWDWFSDMIVGGGREKDSHEWQQAESEATHFIDALCIKGGVVCDPFCGSGTTCLAARKSGRQWIGFEIDAVHVNTARARTGDQYAA
jgi:site-specific DNA-methyltransferase (adenine-specific)